MDDQPTVHALLVCRALDADDQGEISLQNVVEILPVDQLPSEVGPLVLVAFVRGLPAGPTRAAFVLSPPGDAPPGKLPLDLDVPAAYGDRQLALHVRIPTLPVATGGWYEIAFVWNDVALARTRFAVGRRHGS